jgi:outer membrane protein assembly factor BamD (BamD/ComL family)
MMTSKLFISAVTMLRKLVFILLLCGAGLIPPLTSCALLPKSQHQHTTIPSQPKTVDAKAQQYYYDLGLQHYSEENYGEAKKAFHRVIENGPKTALGMKAHENIKKIERILKTLAEIESK